MKQNQKPTSACLALIVFFPHQKFINFVGGRAVSGFNDLSYGRIMRSSRWTDANKTHKSRRLKWHSEHASNSMKRHKLQTGRKEWTPIEKALVARIACDGFFHTALANLSPFSPFSQQGRREMFEIFL